MSNFLEGYEDVNARITRFHQEFPTGRLISYIEDIDVVKGYILIKAEAYKTYEDLYPSAIDYAFEARSDRGVNLHFWVENAVTSAIGRVIGLLTPSQARPTRQDMEKVERLSASDVQANAEKPDLWNTKFPAHEESIPTIGQALENIESAMGGEIFEHAPLCPHGHMILKEGVSPKNNKPYHGYTCSEKVRAKQCPAVWYDLTPSGKWIKQ